MKHRRALPYNPSLDGLRGIAVLLVLLTHFVVPGFGGGTIGVDIFFVLSGYLITNTLMSNEGGLGIFYWRRFLRLFPAMAAVCVALLVVGQLFLDFTQAYKDVIYGGLYVSNWTRMLEPGDPRYLGHFWSVAVEEQFYLMWPAIFLLASRLQKRQALGLIFFLICLSVGWRLYLIHHGAPTARTYNGIDTRADELLIGCGLAFLLRPAPSTSRVMTFFRVGCPVAVVYIICVACFGSNDAPWLNAYGHTLVAIATAIVIGRLAAPQPSVLHGALAWKPLIGVGKISYALYLWHYPIALGILVIFKFPPKIGIPIGIAASFAAAILSYWLIERPILRFRHTIPHKTSKHLGLITANISALGMVLGIGYYWRADISYMIDPTPMHIEAYGPQKIKPGETFNPQPDGRAAFWFKGSRLVPLDTKLVIDNIEQPAPSINGSALVVVGPVIRNTGQLTMQFVSPLGLPRSMPVYLNVQQH